MPLTVSDIIQTEIGSPVANVTVTATPTINPLFQLVGSTWVIIEYGALSATTDATGAFSLSLPWPSACDPATVQWQIRLPDTTVWSGVVPDLVSGPVSIKGLKDSFGWGLVHATGITPIVAVQGPAGTSGGGGGGGGAAATPTSLGTVKVDNASGGSPVSLTQAGLSTSSPQPAGTAAPGTALVASRGDHIHPLTAPQAHETTHLPGGTDALPWALGIMMAGLAAARPAASAANNGLYYWQSDTNGGTLFQSNGSTWTQLTRGVTQGPTAHEVTHLPGGTDAIAWTSVLVAGVAASRPAAAASNNGAVYFATDTNVISQSNGSTWSTILTGGGAGVGVATTATTGSTKVDNNSGGNPVALTQATYPNGAVALTPGSAQTGSTNITGAQQAAGFLANASAVTPPSGTLTFAVSTAWDATQSGLAAGVYHYGLTYQTPWGETTVGAITAFTTSVTDIIQVTIPVAILSPGDATVQWVNLYRTAAGGSTYYRIAQFPPNLLTSSNNTFWDTEADAQLTGDAVTFPTAPATNTTASGVELVATSVRANPTGRLGSATVCATPPNPTAWLAYTIPGLGITLYSPLYS